MSAKNRLENKKLRREYREAKKELRDAQQRIMQEYINELVRQREENEPESKMHGAVAHFHRNLHGC